MEGVNSVDTDPRKWRGASDARILVEGECAAGPPEQIQDLRGEEGRRRDELVHADNGCDALPGGIALPLESAEVGGGDGERAVVEELADRLDRLADIAT